MIHIHITLQESDGRMAITMFARSSDVVATPSKNEQEIVDDLVKTIKIISEERGFDLTFGFPRG